MQLWAVHFADYGDDGVVGIYDTEDGAKACLAECKAKDNKGNYHYFIQTYTLNQKEFNV